MVTCKFFNVTVLCTYQLTWHESMTDSDRPQRRQLCFLSTLLSQKVPERSAAVLRCIIAGQPKPEVTWYKNGQAIEECGIISSYEFFEDQYIHLLQLSCCTQHDAAVYQVSARNDLGMVCCSASLEVESASETPPASPAGGGRGGTGQTCERDTDEEEQPCKEGESISPETPTSPDSSPAKLNDLLHSPQVLADPDNGSRASDNPLDVRGTRPTAVASDPRNTGDSSLPSNNTPGSCVRYQHRTVHSTDDGPRDDSPHEEPSTPSHPNPKAHKYISFSLPLSEATAGIYPDDRPAGSRHFPHQLSSGDSDSDYELCPEITLTCTEEFSDDDLEYLECSDVMTDSSNAVWQGSLQGTGRAFLFESDDEELELSECGLGGGERFLSEMGCGPQVSGDRELMDATPGFRGDHSQSPGVGIGSSRASMLSPSAPPRGMTLTLGPHQDGAAAPFPSALEVAEHACPGIQGETRDSHHAGEESTRDDLLREDKAAREAEGKPLSGGSGTSEMKQSPVSPAEETSERHAGSRRGTPRPTKGGCPRMKGNAKKLIWKESSPEGTLNPPSQEPRTHPRTQSNQKQTLHTKARHRRQNSHLHLRSCATSPTTERDSLSKEEDPRFQGERVQAYDLFETHRIPDHSHHLQVQIPERGSSSQMPPSSDPPAEESPSTGTTTNLLSNSEGTHKEEPPLAQYLELDNCTRDPSQTEKQDREGSPPSRTWADLGHELNIPETNDENTYPAASATPPPQEASHACNEPEPLCIASQEPLEAALPLANPCGEPRGRDAASMTECFEAGDQGTCYDTMDLPVGAPVDKYLPQEICSMDFERTEGQSKVCDLCPPDDKILAVLPPAAASESPQSTCEKSRDRNLTTSPLWISAFTWDMSQGASKGVPGANLAEVEDYPSILASTIQAVQEGSNPCFPEGFGAIHPLPSENESFVYHHEGGNEIPRPSTPLVTDTPTRHCSVLKAPRERPAATTANSECLQVARETEDTSPVAIASKVYPAKYYTVSVSEDSQLDGTEESSPEASDVNHYQPPPSVESGHILSGSMTESTGGLLCLTPSVPEVSGLEGEEFCSNSPLQTDDQSLDESQMGFGADNGFEEDFQEKGSERKQRTQADSLPYHSSLSAPDFQESLSQSSAAQKEDTLVPSELCPENSREETGFSSSLEPTVPVVAEAVMEEHIQTLSNVPSLSEILLGESRAIGLGNWGAGNKVKIITLEIPDSEVWPSRQVTDPDCKETEVGSTVLGRAWALPDVLKADAAGADPVPWGDVAGALSPVLGNNWKMGEGDTPARIKYWGSLSSQGLSQPRFLESSVDPVEKEELCIIDSLSQASETEGKGDASNVSQEQGENQLKIDNSTHCNQCLTFPNIWESSVDPVDETGETEYAGAEDAEPSAPIVGAIGERSESTGGNVGQGVQVPPTLLQVPCSPKSEETIPGENRTNQDQVVRERGEAELSQNEAPWQASHSEEGLQGTPRASGVGQVQRGNGGSSGDAEQSERDMAEFLSPSSPLSSCPAGMTREPVEVETHYPIGPIHGQSAVDCVEPRNHQPVFCNAGGRGSTEKEHGKHVPPCSDLTPWPCHSSPQGNVTGFSISQSMEELKTEELQIGEPKAPSSSGSPAMTLALLSGECESEKAPAVLLDPCQKGSLLGSGKKFKEKEKSSHMAAQAGKLAGARSSAARSEEIKKKQETSGSGHVAEGVKKKILSRVAALRLRLEEKENVRKNSGLPKKIPKLEKSLSRTTEKKEPRKAPCKREGKAPILLKKIQAEMFPDHSGNVTLSCQFAEIHEDSTIWWTKDSKSIAQVQKSAGDNSSVSLAIVQAGQKDEGLYYCCIKNSYGNVGAEFNLTAEVLQQLSSLRESKGCEEIEFSQLIFREDFLNDSYFGDHLRGQISTEELHFGEGVHRKAFRSTVMQGLMPVFQPGHSCVLKVHNAIAHGTRNNAELVQRNYKLAAQECYVQNTARHYAKIYAAEAQPLEGFGEVPEIIPIFLIHRPENNIPYATVEEELIGEFVKYSIRDGKEINFLRRDSEAGQKCCTFQHWVYEKTSGCLLVTDMQGVGMKLTDVGIATLAKGYKGFKGNCSMTFIDQFKALHQCNKYCHMLGLKSLPSSSQKPKKPSTGKSRVQTSSTAVKKPGPGIPAEKKA
ncbi:alpha-protein kinase 2 [Perognathus longimembris pacificus]|uniref:alpha-protein kinase 2 n=1 Tax=Perognathus longimembris pacificus TaxID=214514 RepID=UPI00201840DC|nr:alpha-protein kinase 2 [Perognathus longimembris pacificus]XP_048219471.1 alpha-protein kinase 2 [Perognathus longimembris pacificus]XP_048219472.1 alpha-protein kinase 2 [Perognathus longimembris pacificus]